MNHYPIKFFIFKSGIRREGPIKISCELPIVPRIGDEVVIDIDEKTFDDTSFICTVKKVKIYTMFSDIEIEVVIND